MKKKSLRYKLNAYRVFQYLITLFFYRHPIRSILDEGKTLVAGTIITNQYLPAMYPTLRHALHIFTTRNRQKLEQWSGGGMLDFEGVHAELLSVVEFAWSKEKLAELRQTMKLSKKKGELSILLVSLDNLTLFFQAF